MFFKQYCFFLIFIAFLLGICKVKTDNNQNENWKKVVETLIKSEPEC